MIVRAVAVLTASFFLLPVLATWQPGVPVPLRLLAFVILAATLGRPAWGLMLVAGFVPVATPLHLMTGAPFSGTATVELLLAPLVAGAAMRIAVVGLRTHVRLLAPALVFASVLVAVAVVQLSVLEQGSIGPDQFLAGVPGYLAGPYFVDPGRFPLLHDLVIWCATLALAVIAEYVLRSAPESRAAVLRTVAAGVTAGASVALYRLLEVSIRAPEPFARAWEVIRSVRFNPHFADLNAAGSLYALVLVPMVWWALTSRHRTAWLPVGVVAFALWATGSRAALAAAIIGLGLAWVCQRRPPLRHVLIAGLAVLPFAWLTTQYTRETQVTPGTAIGVRVELLKVGADLTTEAPVFGLGFRSFQPASMRRISPELMARYPGLERGENAHNNFLQILVEFGAIGLAAFVWLLVAAARPFAADLRLGGQARAAVGIAGGVTAFLITCLAGHPLLIGQVLAPFGLFLGLLAGASTGAPPAPQSRVMRGSVAVLALALLLSAIPRAAAARAHAPLAGVVVGATPRQDPEFPRAWSLEGHGRWYLAADTRVVLLRFRLVSGDPAVCRYAVLVDGRPFTTEGRLNTEPVRLVVTLPVTGRAVASRHVDIELSGPGCLAVVDEVAPRS